MRRSIRDNRTLFVFLTLAILAHVSLFMLPLAKKMARHTADLATVRITLSVPPDIQPVEIEEKRESRPVPLESIPEPIEPTEVSTELVASESREAPGEQTPIETTAEEQPEISSREIIARQFLMEADNGQAYVRAIDENKTAPDYFPAVKTSLDEALNQPVLQLPFRDTRIYEVAYYEAGVNGAIDKFWDSVTVPFGFTTRNNTRIQCAWVLIFAGCSWGHKTLYYREAQKRRDEGEEQPY